MKARIFPFLITVVILLAPGCETSFDAFTSDDLRIYSVFGYLDSSADTQWVRIEEIRDSLLVGSNRFNARVILEHLDSGESVSFSDSIFRYEPGASYAHNFWAPTRIEPGKTYRLVIQRPDGKETTAASTLPEYFPDPSFENAPLFFEPCNPWYNPSEMVVEITGIERMVDLKVIYRLKDPLEAITLSYLDRSEPASRGFKVKMDWDMDIGGICQANRLERFDLVIGSGSSDWPAPTSSGTDTRFISELWSNVINGSGYFGGVTVRHIPVPLTRAVMDQ